MARGEFEFKLELKAGLGVRRTGRNLVIQSEHQFTFPAFSLNLFRLPPNIMHHAHGLTSHPLLGLR